MKRLLKSLLIVAVLLIAAYLIIGFFIPDDMHIERETVIKAPPEKVFMAVSDFEAWEHWSPWHDSSLNMTFTGEPAEPGAKMTWQDSDNGNGSQEIMEAKPFAYLKTKLNFSKGQATFISEFKLSEEDDGTHISWAMSGSDFSYPFEKYAVLLMKKKIGESFELGLDQLKTYVENLGVDAKPQKIDITEKELETVQLLVIEDSCKMANVSQLMEDLYSSLMEYVHKNNIDILGPPVSIYKNFNPDGYTIFIAGVPVPEDTKGSGEIQSIPGYAGKVIMATHYGAYNEVGPVWDAMDTYIQDNGHQYNGYPWEEYVTDPSQEPDTSKWITNIYIPVQ